MYKTWLNTLISIQERSLKRNELKVLFRFYQNIGGNTHCVKISPFFHSLLSLFLHSLIRLQHSQRVSVLASALYNLRFWEARFALYVPMGCFRSCLTLSVELCRAKWCFISCYCRFPPRPRPLHTLLFLPSPSCAHIIYAKSRRKAKGYKR